VPDSAFLQHVYPKQFNCLNRVWRGVRTQDGWKYIVLEHQPFALFNLNEDPYELNNLAFLNAYDEKREELQAQLADWLDKTGDTFPLPR
jgi:arylsulfatase A-like enzyme